MSQHNFLILVLLESTTVKAIRQAAASVCSLSETEFDIRFNPDIFSPSVRHSDPPSESLADPSTPNTNAENKEKTDEEVNTEASKEVSKTKKYPSLDLQIRLNKEACEFLMLYQIPQFVRDITSNRYWSNNNKHDLYIG